MLLVGHCGQQGFNSLVELFEWCAGVAEHDSRAGGGMRGGGVVGEQDAGVGTDTAAEVYERTANPDALAAATRIADLIEPQT